MAVPGIQLPEFMEKSIRESNFVLVVCTPKYKNKSDNRKGGVGYEGNIITSEIFQKNNNQKFIAVLRKGDWEFALPTWAAGKLSIDLSGDPYNKKSYQDLIRILHNKWYTPPPVGRPPDFPDEDDDVLDLSKAKDSPDFIPDYKKKNQEIELKTLESQAIQYELKGDFWNARKTWYEIKQISPLFPRLDIKIRELEREVEKKISREKAERESAEKATYQKAERRVSAIDALKRFFSKNSLFFRIVGILGIIATLFWVGSLAIPKFNSLIQITKAAATQPGANATSVNSSVAPSKTPRSSPALTKAPSPTSSSTEITDAKGIPLILVPAGNFIMGKDDGSYGPAHTVYLDAFYIDKYEVTNARYKACVDAGVCDSPQNFRSSTRTSYYEVIQNLIITQ